MIRIRSFIYCLVFLSILGCTSMKVGHVETQTLSATDFVNPKTTAELATTINIPTSTLVAPLKIDMVNPYPGLKGNLLVLTENKKTLIIVNMADYTFIEKSLPEGCVSLIGGKKVLCTYQDIHDKNNNRLFVYDIEKETSIILYECPFEPDNIFPNPQLTKISCYKKESDGKYTLFVYDLMSGQIENQFPILKSEWFSLPKPTLNDDIFWGLTYYNHSRTNITEWLPEKGKAINFYKSDTYLATGDYSVSPNGDLIIVGAWSTRPIDIIPSYDNLLIYQNSTTATKIFSSPAQYSLQWNSTNFYNEWSPDSKLFAMNVLTNEKINPNSFDYYQGICIIDILSLNTSCQNKLQGGVGPIAWSPDSNYLAVVTGGNEIFIVSVKENRLYHFGTINGIDSRGIDLKWSQ